MSYSHVLLDLDHTLLDTETSLALAFVDAMTAVDADPTGLYPVFNDINQALWKKVETHECTPPQVHLARFVQLDEQLGLGAAPQAMADAFALGMGRHGDLYDGAREMLDVLTSLATLALVTNGLSDIQRARIERLDLGKYFDAITISAEVGCAKPGIEIFDLTFASLGLDAGESRASVLMVGDSLGSDIAGGNNAGINTCWYNPDRDPANNDHPATYTIADLAELVPVVSGS